MNLSDTPDLRKHEHDLLTAAADYFDTVAGHIGGEMPGIAGNCTIWAKRLRDLLESPPATELAPRK